MATLLYRNQIFGYLAIACGALLLIPLISMQLTAEVNWGHSDFLLMGAMLFGFSSGFVLLGRKITPSNRRWLAVAVIILFLYCWAELAVGVFFSLGS